MARQPNSPWNLDYKIVTRNPNIGPGKPRLTIDGAEVDLDTYQAHQRARALEMRAKTRRGSK